jgi:F-type H+-transporting ATPase subunit a
MDELTRIPQISMDLFGMNLVFNTETLLMTWIAMGLLILFAFLASRKMGIVPNLFQVLGELIVTAFFLSSFVSTGGP